MERLQLADPQARRDRLPERHKNGLSRVERLWRTIGLQPLPVVVKYFPDQMVLEYCPRTAHQAMVFVEGSPLVFAKIHLASAKLDVPRLIL